MLIVMFLPGCTTDPDDLAAAASDALDQMAALVDEHAEEVRGTDSMMEAMNSEDTHHAEMVTLMSGLQHTMDDMTGCGMSSMMMDGMTRANHHMDEMWDEVEKHQDSHADHVDMQDCWAGEDVYQPAMHDHMARTRDDMFGFEEDADCGHGEGPMGM
jgi:hypothetical protein